MLRYRLPTNMFNNALAAALMNNRMHPAEHKVATQNHTRSTPPFNSEKAAAKAAALAASRQAAAQKAAAAAAAMSNAEITPALRTSLDRRFVLWSALSLEPYSMRQTFGFQLFVSGLSQQYVQHPTSEHNLDQLLLGETGRVKHAVAEKLREQREFIGAAGPFCALQIELVPAGAAGPYYTLAVSFVDRAFACHTATLAVRSVEQVNSAQALVTWIESTTTEWFGSMMHSGVVGGGGSHYPRNAVLPGDVYIAATLSDATGSAAAAAHALNLPIVTCAVDRLDSAIMAALGLGPALAPVVDAVVESSHEQQQQQEAVQEDANGVDPVLASMNFTFAGDEDSSNLQAAHQHHLQQQQLQQQQQHQQQQQQQQQHLPLAQQLSAAEAAASATALLELIAWVNAVFDLLEGPSGESPVARHSSPQLTAVQEALRRQRGLEGAALPVADSRSWLKLHSRMRYALALQSELTGFLMHYSSQPSPVRLAMSGEGGVASAVRHLTAEEWRTLQEVCSVLEAAVELTFLMQSPGRRGGAICSISQVQFLVDELTAVLAADAHQIRGSGRSAAAAAAAAASSGMMLAQALNGGVIGGTFMHHPQQQQHNGFNASSLLDDPTETVATCSLTPCAKGLLGALVRALRASGLGTPTTRVERLAVVLDPRYKDRLVFTASAQSAAREELHAAYNELCAAAQRMAQSMPAHMAPLPALPGMPPVMQYQQYQQQQVQQQQQQQSAFDSSAVLDDEHSEEGARKRPRLGVLQQRFAQREAQAEAETAATQALSTMGSLQSEVHAYLEEPLVRYLRGTSELMEFWKDKA
jgi:hypothetical protein